MVNLSRPTLLWEVWSGSGSTVSNSEMALDGKTVPSEYDADTHSLSYTPEGPLRAGEHQVSCQVTIDGSLPVRKDWHFSIPSDAPASVPIATSQQRQLIQSINEYRRQMDLPDFACENRLAAAALAHTEYLHTNNITGHCETPGKPGFIGAMPLDRLESFGYMQDSWECVDYGGDNQDECLKDLFDAPYHRIPFMQPGNLKCGSGYDDRHLTVEFEMAKLTGTTVWPYNGQKEVEPSWSSHERPDPLRMHVTSGPVGYPIVFNQFTPDYEKITLQGASLKSDDGGEVPIFVNSPSNDNKLSYSVIIMAQSPLRPNTTYSVWVKVATESGQTVSKNWSFTTSSGRTHGPRGR